MLAWKQTKPRRRCTFECRPATSLVLCSVCIKSAACEDLEQTSSPTDFKDPLQKLQQLFPVDSMPGDAEFIEWPGRLEDRWTRQL